MGRQIFQINTENACKWVYLFWCILRAIYIEISGSTLEKKCRLIRNLTYSLEWNAIKNFCELVWLEYMHIFPAGRSTSRSGCEGKVGGKGGESTLWFVGQECPMWPKNLSLYYSMFCCNFVTLAILDVCLFNSLNERRRNKTTTIKSGVKGKGLGSDPFHLIEIFPTGKGKCTRNITATNN